MTQRKASPLGLHPREGLQSRALYHGADVSGFSFGSSLLAVLS